MSTTLHVDPGSQPRSVGWEEGSGEGSGADGEWDDFKPLTSAEAQRWRDGQPPFSVWRVVAMQCLVGWVAGGLAWLFTQSPAVTWSVLYGAVAVVVPSALMAYGLTSSVLSRLSAGFAQAAFAGFLFWEGVKVLLVVALLFLAPRIVSDLNWLALVAGLVLVLKVYWFGFWIQARRANLNG